MTGFTNTCTYMHFKHRYLCPPHPCIKQRQADCYNNDKHSYNAKNDNNYDSNDSNSDNSNGNTNNNANTNTSDDDNTVSFQHFMFVFAA